MGKGWMAGGRGRTRARELRLYDRWAREEDGGTIYRAPWEMGRGRAKFFRVGGTNVVAWALDSSSPALRLMDSGRDDLGMTRGDEGHEVALQQAVW